MAGIKYILPVLLLLSACGSASDSGDHSEPHNMTGGLVGVWNPDGEPKGQIILHHGHDTFDGKNDPTGNLIPVAEKFAAAGYVVYGMEMPPLPHDGRPLSDFTDPVAALLDAIGPAYMIGLSGGGWTTTVVTATDERIIKGFSVAGDVPMDMRDQADPNTYGDWEQHSLGLDYRALYEQAGDRLLHIYNFADPCCFSGIQGDIGYPYETDHTHSEHKISDWAVEVILLTLVD